MWASEVPESFGRWERFSLFPLCFLMLDVSVMGKEASGGMGHTLGGLKIP